VTQVSLVRAERRRARLRRRNVSQVPQMPLVPAQRSRRRRRRRNNPSMPHVRQVQQMPLMGAQRQRAHPARTQTHPPLEHLKIRKNIGLGRKHVRLRSSSKMGEPCSRSNHLIHDREQLRLKSFEQSPYRRQPASRHLPGKYNTIL
jgi:hypothetical protein